jgi:hypothetical protein
LEFFSVFTAAFFQTALLEINHDWTGGLNSRNLIRAQPLQFPAFNPQLCTLPMKLFQRLKNRKESLKYTSFFGKRIMVLKVLLHSVDLILKFTFIFNNFEHYFT